MTDELIRAITLVNPWPHAITHLGKPIENRSWGPKVQPSRLYLHSGVRWDLEAAERLGITETARASIPTSAIVAVAVIGGVCRASLYSDAGLLCECGEWAEPGKKHWQLTDVTVLAEPVPCRGKQGLWTPAPHVIAAVRAQVCDHRESFRHLSTSRRVVAAMWVEHTVERCQQCKTVLRDVELPIRPAGVIDHTRVDVLSGGAH